jgi:hypothetical protein
VIDFEQSLYCEFQGHPAVAMAYAHKLVPLDLRLAGPGCLMCAFVACVFRELLI